jgi:hypothetical protein
MRFLAHGPSIPDRLLTARDAGEVLFFCGAGVSRHKADLSDFEGLAWKVADRLGSTKDSLARQLLRASGPDEHSVPSRVPLAVDRVFSLLQREFEVIDVQRAVAQALVAKTECDLSPHRHLIELSRTRSGPPRLVTTNFDRLFERAAPDVTSHASFPLPDPRRPEQFHGIVHLHGAVNANYDGASNGEFVLSSAEFGHAYLADGWATRYIQALLERFQIVFVGYSADDPPVQYLLEAMNRSQTGEPRLYAFHNGTVAEAEAQWSHRGVRPIAYAAHDDLWNTLAAWAERARDVDEWHRRVIEKAQVGPTALAPHERGIVAHIVNSADGARHLGQTAQPLPAEWLFVFDRAVRYSRSRIFGNDDGSPDPFETLCLDSDPAPLAADPENRASRRNPPPEAWHAFDISIEDRQAIPANACARLVGLSALSPARLSQRLAHLSGWIARIAHQPAAVWWAAGSRGLAPDLARQIEWKLTYRAEPFSPEVRKGWRWVLAGSDSDPDALRSALNRDVEDQGWSGRIVEAAVALYQPHLTVRRPTEEPWLTQPVDVTVSSLVHVDVEYPRPQLGFDFPAEYCSLAVRLLRRRLEDAVALETQLNPNPYFHLDRIRIEEGEQYDEHSYNIGGLVASYVKVVDQLAATDRNAARDEVRTWSTNEDEVFGRLRIWAAGRPDLTSAADAEATLTQLDVAAFWVSTHQADLLYAMRDRWAELSAPVTWQLEDRLLNEDLPWFQYREDRPSIVAHHRLSRLQWLRNHGVAFSFDYAEVVAKLSAMSPEWRDDVAHDAATRSHIGIRSVTMDDNDAPLEGVPLSKVVDVAADVAGAHENFAKQRDPFSGLAKRRPVHALRALSAAAREENYPVDGWNTLLNTVPTDKMSLRMLLHIARYLLKLPRSTLQAIRHATADWYVKFAARLGACNYQLADDLWNAIVAAAAITDIDEIRRPEIRDWVGEAINRPIGKLSEWLFQDERLKHVQRDGGLPEDWLQRLEGLMVTPAPHGQYAIAMAARQLPFLYHTAPAWTEHHLLPLATDGESGFHAFWAGFLSAARTPQPPLYLHLKTGLLSRATDKVLRQSYRRIAAGMLLAGWRGSDTSEEPRYPVTDEEFRDTLINGGDELRVHTLWQLGRRAVDETNRWGDHVIPFLQKVWPLQRAVRTSASSTALFELAFQVPEELFTRVVDNIADRLTEISAHANMSVMDDQTMEQFVIRHANALLRLLWIALPEDADLWPYQAGDLVDALVKQEHLKGASRLDELLRRRYQRKWIL